MLHTLQDLETLVRIYIAHVLIPAGQIAEVASLVESSSLDQSAKDRLLASYPNQVSPPQHIPAQGSSSQAELATPDSALG